MRQERLYRTEGIVLKAMDYGEADRILTVLTPAGKASMLAKGVRRSTSRKSGHLELYARTNLLVARGRNLDIITQAEGIESFEGLRHELLRFTYACYAAELVDGFAQEGEGSDAIYGLLLHGLRRFAESDDLRLWMRFFELRLLSLAGYRPELYRCVECGAEVRAEPNAFAPGKGGVLCRQCCGHHDPEPARRLSVNAQKVMRFLLTRGQADVSTLRLLETTHAEVEAVTQDYLEYVLERQVRSVAFLRRLRALYPSHGAQAVEAQLYGPRSSTT